MNEHPSLSFLYYMYLCEFFLHTCLFTLFFVPIYIFSQSVQSLSRVWLFVTPWTAAHQASVSITNSLVYSNSCPLSRWCHPTISSSVVSFSSCLQSFPGSGSFQMCQLFTSDSQSIGVSASTTVLPMNTLESSPTPQFKSIHSSVLSFLYSPTLTSIHDHWKNHSLD